MLPQTVRVFPVLDMKREMVNSTGEQKLNLLLLCDYNLYTAGTILDHIGAFTRFSRHHVLVVPMKGALPGELDLDRFDGLIIHYSLWVCNDKYISPTSRLRLRNFKGWKAVFVQDDYRGVHKTVEALRSIRIQALFCLAPADVMEAVYPSDRLPGVERTTVLAGYVQNELNSVPIKPFDERPIDVGYRARKLPAWIGSHGQEKWLIADRFLADAGRYGLRVDISCREEDRIYGSAWTEFVSNCKAVLGTESGSSVCDFTGEIQQAVEQHERAHPGTPFEVLSDLYFKDADGKIMMNIISPRCFEAASLRTLMVLYPGKYSGILQPWRHYVPLDKDHGNTDEIVSVLRDPVRANRIIEQAYCEVALNPRYSYQAMVKQFDEVLEQTFEAGMKAVKLSYSSGQLHSVMQMASRMHAWKSIGDSAGIFLYRVGHWFFRALVSDGKQVPIRQLIKNLFIWCGGMKRVLRDIFAKTRILTRGLAELPVAFYMLLFQSKVSFRDRVTAVHEAVTLETIRRSGSRVGLTATWLVWNSELGQLKLVGYDHEPPIISGCAPLSAQDLVGLLRNGKVRELAWVVHDLQGIGLCFPLNAECRVTALVRLGYYAPEYVAEFITRCDSWPHWCERSISEDVSPIEMMTSDPDRSKRVALSEPVSPK